MATRTEFVAEVRTWVGTPFGHQGRSKGVCVDCIGVPLCSAKAVGLFPADFEFRNYRRQPDHRMMEAMLDEHMDRVTGSPKPGDVPWMEDEEWGGHPMHLGVLTFNGTMIHSRFDVDNGRGRKPGRCVEERFTKEIEKTVERFYSFRGIVDA